MKEKIKHILKQKYIKYLILLLIGLFFINESYNIYVDMYNFKQLEKVKIILKDLKISDKRFYNLKGFNEIYKSNIKPIKNCYDIANLKDETKVPYIFGFKLESLIYIYIYMEQNIMCILNMIMIIHKYVYFEVVLMLLEEFLKI
ncbi:MAG: hypothetical protein PHR68_03065 [Candidatus Gracilibacteria bacterium]|nr:hypothetical protein [Candidatus Gracilibacteria bacterium]